MNAGLSQWEQAGLALSAHSMHNPQALWHQESCVRRVVDSVDDLDHVLDLCTARGRSAVEWSLPTLGRTWPGARPLPGGDYVATVAPYTGDAVLYPKQIE